jgi:tRNA threonylcarbamoyladenosine biosynthesis protein TsaE
MTNALRAQMQLKARNLKETINLGQALGEYVQPSTVIVLSGDLGAGKTQIAQALAQGLGMSDPITSPTFAILKNYDSGRIPLNHMDLYRLEKPEQLADIDFWDLVAPNSVEVTLIEWGDMFDEVLAETDLQLILSITGAESREIELKAYSEQGAELLIKAAKTVADRGER